MPFPFPHPKLICSKCGQDFTFIGILPPRQRKMKENFDMISQKVMRLQGMVCISIPHIPNFSSAKYFCFLSSPYQNIFLAPHSSTLAWKIPWTEEPGRLQFMWSLKSDMTEQLHFHFSLSCAGEGNGNLLQCSCLKNPRDRAAWWAAICGVTQSWTLLKQLSSSSILLDGKESACNTGDMCLILGLGRPPREGNGYTPVLLPESFHGQRSLAGYSPWGCKESDTTEQLMQHTKEIKS